MASVGEQRSLTSVSVDRASVSIDAPPAATADAPMPATPARSLLPNATVLSVVFLVVVACSKTLVTKVQCQRAQRPQTAQQHMDPGNANSRDSLDSQAAFVDLQFTFPVFLSLMSCVITALACVVCFSVCPTATSPPRQTGPALSPL